MRKILILLVAASFLFSGCAIIKKNFNASVDKPSGTLKMDGIKSKVTISRDNLGIPYIEAESEDDLFFATGYAMASDRLWQMYLRSMVMQGRLSEIVGKDTLETDIYFRTLGIKELVNGALATLDKKHLASIESFSKGVNAYISTHKKLPPEFSITGYKPDPWTPADSLYCFSAVSYGLSYNLYEELDFLVLASRLGYEKMPWLFPVYSGYSLPVDETKKLSDIPASELMGSKIGKMNTAFNLDGIVPKPMPASNNWAIMGSKTLSGKSIVCNDTHLMPSTPSEWLIMHLKCPTYEAAGVMAPGLPVVVLGYNGKIAWGITMVSADSQDIFVEKLKTEGGSRSYLYKGQWLPVTQRKETFKIKSSDKPVEKIISATCHGPLLNTNIKNVPFSSEIMPDSSRYGLALSWANQGMTDTFAGFYTLAGAGNVDEARNCILKVGAMYLNFVFGDSDNIGWQVSGICPVRKNGVGLLPSPGWTGEYDWTGYAPVEKMPGDKNPSKGFLATANNAIVPPDYPVMISSSWACPERIERIESILSPIKNTTTGDMMTMQFDRYSLMAFKVQKMLFEGPFAQEIRTAIGKLSPKDRDKANKCLELLDPKVFDCNMKPTSPNAAVMGAFYHTATINTFLDEFGPMDNPQWKALGRLTGRYSSVDTFLDKFKQYDATAWKCLDSTAAWGYSAQEDHLLARPDSPLWDDPRTDAKETKADIIAVSLADAVILCEKRMGTDPAKWQWGRLLHYDFRHDISEEMPLGLLKDYLNPGMYPAGGDWNTINVAGFSLADGMFEVSEIPAMRLIVNFGEDEPAHLVSVPGQSGNPSSPHYRDMLKDYFITGENHPLVFKEVNVRKQYKDVLTLIPGK
jgi:acyl-homoserine-lactone acylase